MLLIGGILLAALSQQADAGWIFQDGSWFYVGDDSQVYGIIRTPDSRSASDGRTGEAPSARPESARAPSAVAGEEQESARDAESARVAAKKRPSAKKEGRGRKANEESTQQSGDGEHPADRIKPAKAASKPAETAEARPPEPSPRAQAAPAEGPIDVEAGAFPVSKFVPTYVLDSRGLPDPEEILEVEVELVEVDGKYVAPEPGEIAIGRSLEELGVEPPKTFTASALLRINERIVAFFNAHDIYGVYVTPHYKDIEEKWQRDEEGRPKRVEFVDRRPKDRTELRILIFVGRVAEARTLAAGDRIPEDERVNHPAHAWLLRRSPVQPVSEDGTGGLLHKEQLDRYVLFLNRHPGREVDVSVARSDKPGEVALDYHVTESKPWIAYHQTSNTGTEETGEWRSRFGFIHNQLTGHDDILALDYVTAQFNTTHAASLSYEAPVLGFERLRYVLYGTYSEFLASEVGLPDLAEEDFRGYGWSAGADLYLNFLQHKDLFIDFVAGVRWQHEHIINLLADIEAETEMWLPSVGFRFERNNDLERFGGVVRVEWLDDHVANTNHKDLRRFGRFQPDTEWVVVRWNLSEAFFLEPLLNREAWEDVDTPETSTLAHEVSLEFKGQHSLGHRLIPSAESTVGGVYSVRGYPESVVAGDTVYVGTVEYRYHIPKALKPSTAFDEPREPARILGRPFRFRPQHVYGRTDWDLVFKTFFDIGKANMYDRLDPPLEENRLLMGTGVGFELRILRNLSVQLDYGVALRGIDEREVDAGDQRLHVIATLSF